MLNQFTKYQVATAIAILFHAIGLVGLLFFDKEFFLRSTPMNLLLMLVLLVWTQSEKNGYFFLFLLACFFTGLGVEIIGVKTGALFGHYNYGNVMGYKVMDVPLLLGVNWFIVVYCSGVAMYTLLSKLINRVAQDTGKKPLVMKALSIIIDGATLAVFYDWLMEPVAIKLGYWQWGADGSVPIYNYICWFIISILLLAVFHFGKFKKHNKFAVNLLLIQLMFFLVLRSFLN